MFWLLELLSVTSCGVFLIMTFMNMIVTVSLCSMSHIERLTEEGVSDVLRHLIP